MIQMMTYNNPINNVEETLQIDLDLLNIDYDKWKNDFYWLQKGIEGVLLDILQDLDCTRIYKSGRPMMLSYPRYKILIAEYFRFLYKIIDFELYNFWFDKLIARHEENISFEFYNPITKKKPTKSKKQQSKPNKWIKAVTNDLFTGEERYIYENLKTGEIITSGNPNLLDELNSKPKKKNKKEEVNSVANLKIIKFIF